MGAMLESLTKLQAIERQLTQVRSRLRSRTAAVNIQQKRIDQAQADWQTIHDRIFELRKTADRQDLDLKTKDAQVAKLRTALNTSKTNKDYSAILTEINTHKADNERLADEILKAMDEIESLEIELKTADETSQAESKKMEEVRAISADEIERLTKMADDLARKRLEATEGVDPSALATFDRIASSFPGEAMAMIEVHGKKPPFEYICGGCYMGLSAEHANALSVRDEIRTCDNCGKILYMDSYESNASR
ncbi:MAG TPA: hypothetical protein ENL03_01275 [Phycisphaerae bacterium]|nr:hypothetical protein [Phycisphaerae bacterium]